MQGNVVIRVGPAAEPVSLTEAKAHCRVDGSDEDSLITALITAARAHAEIATGRAMVTQTLRSTFEFFPCDMTLNAPLRKVTAVTYLDSSGALQTLSDTDYVVDTSELPGYIERAYSATWPVTYDHPAAVAVDFIAGYATPFTATSNTLTAKGHPFANGDSVRLSNTGGVLPTGLAASTNYYAIGVSGDTLQLSLTEGGTAVVITGNGTGTHFIGGPDDSSWVAMRQAMLLMIGHWFDRRESTTEYQAHELPMGVAALLGHHKVWGF